MAFRVYESYIDLWMIEQNTEQFATCVASPTNDTDVYFHLEKVLYTKAEIENVRDLQKTMMFGT